MVRKALCAGRPFLSSVLYYFVMDELENLASIVRGLLALERSVALERGALCMKIRIPSKEVVGV